MKPVINNIANLYHQSIISIEYNYAYWLWDDLDDIFIEQLKSHIEQELSNEDL